MSWQLEHPEKAIPEPKRSVAIAARVLASLMSKLSMGVQETVTTICRIRSWRLNS